MSTLLAPCGSTPHETESACRETAADVRLTLTTSKPDTHLETNGVKGRRLNRDDQVPERSVGINAAAEPFDNRNNADSGQYSSSITSRTPRSETGQPTAFVTRHNTVCKQWSHVNVLSNSAEPWARAGDLTRRATRQFDCKRQHENHVQVRQVQVRPVRTSHSRTTRFEIECTQPSPSTEHDESSAIVATVRASKPDIPNAGRSCDSRLSLEDDFVVMWLISTTCQNPSVTHQYTYSAQRQHRPPNRSQLQVRAKR